MNIYKYLKCLILVITGTNIIIAQSLKGVLPSYSDEKIEYTVKSPSIRIKLPEILYWDSIQILKDGVEINKKEIFIGDNEFYKLYDSLSYTNYTVRHISSFQDIFEYKLKIESDTIIEYPKEDIEYSYRDVELEDLQLLLETDTLKLVIQEIDCYNFSETYFEIINIGSKSKIQDNRKENQIHLLDSDFKKKISDMIVEFKDIKDCYTGTCSDIYSLKAKDSIYTFYNCCVSEKLITSLKNVD